MLHFFNFGSKLYDLRANVIWNGNCFSQKQKFSCMMNKLHIPQGEFLLWVEISGGGGGGGSDPGEILLYNTGKAKKNMCVYCHMLKKIRVGRSEILFFYFIFYN